MTDEQKKKVLIVSLLICEGIAPLNLNRKQLHAHYKTLVYDVYALQREKFSVELLNDEMQNQ